MVPLGVSEYTRSQNNYTGLGCKHLTSPPKKTNTGDGVENDRHVEIRVSFKGQKQ